MLISTIFAALDMPNYGNYRLDESSLVNEDGCIPLTGVVSLLDVLTFAAEDFWEASQSMSELGKLHGGHFTLQSLKLVMASYLRLMEHVEALNLPVTIKESAKIHEWVKGHVEGDLRIPDSNAADFNKSFAQKIEALSSVLHSELSSRLFFCIPAERANYYDLKGCALDSFPATAFDWEEAGNCYAFGRGTACVFHLMRIMEVGVQRLGDSLGVLLASEKNWQNILDEVNKAIRKRPQRDSATIEKCGASANLYSVKVAWRNEVMHPNDKYTLEEADNLIRLVRLFMTQLARVL